MGQYLKVFQDKIGKRQGDQILKLLNRKKNIGQIKTVDEFASQLEKLMRDLSSTILTPSLKIWMAEQNEIIDSDTYNFMLDRVEDDLTAAFEEANNINEVQISHEALIRDVILKNLKAGIAELESKVTLYEFLNKDFRGFDSAIFSTFRESKGNKTERDISQLTQTLFNDHRTNNLFTTTQDAFVELVGERLILPLSDRKFYNLAGIRQIFDTTTPQSEIIVSPPNLNLNNIIDNTNGTYWVQSLLFKNKKENVKVKLELDLGAVKEVNFIEIEPVSRFEVILESIHYLDGNNISKSIDFVEKTISGPLSLRINKIATNKLFFTFRNENYRKTQFKYDPNYNNLQDQALLESPETTENQFKAISKDLIRTLSNTKIKDLLPLSTSVENVFSGYEFIFGIDNIRIGLVSHISKGVYVSSPLSTCGVGQLGLKTLETRPYIENSVISFTNQTYDIDMVPELTDPYFLGSIEYWIIKQDFNKNAALIQTKIFPILPLGVEKIYHERLLLTEKSSSILTINNIGKTIFFTLSSTVSVYKNGTLMTNETGNPTATTGWQWENTGVSDDATPNKGAPMQFRIKILDPLPGDIFTVSYTPSISTTKSIPKTLSEFTSVGGLQVVDLTGDLEVINSEAQQVILNKTSENDTTVSSKLYLSIILRQNTAESSLTPAVEEYTLFSGCKDSTKFETE